MEYGIGAAIYDCITLDVATKFLTTRESATQALNNLALVAALMLTMTSISGSAEVGDRLGFVDEESAEAIYVAIASFGLMGFFVSTGSSSTVLIYASFLQNDAEFHAYVSQMSYLWKVTLGTFFVGFFGYVASQIWLLMSLLGPKVALTLAAPGFVLLITMLFGFAHSAQTVQRIRDKGGLMKAEATDC